MSMYIPTGEIRRTGNELADIAAKMQKLSNRASSINSAISGCYMQGGVGWRAGNAASQMGSIASKAQTKGKNLCTAAGIYEKKENDLTSRSCSVASNIQNGYNVSWCTNPAIQCILGTGTVVGESALSSQSGFNLGGDISGDLIGGSVKKTVKTDWDLSKGNLDVNVGIQAKGYLAKGEASGYVGIASGKVSAEVGSGAVGGKAGISLYENGKLSPKVYGEAKAEAALVKGKVEGQIGNEETNVHVKGEGTVLGAEAKAKGGIGKITTEDSSGKSVTGYGVEGKVSAEAYLVQGKVSGGVTVLGIKIDASVSGKAGGAGIKAGGSVTTNGVSGEIGAGLGLGAGVKISIDWSGFDIKKLKFW